MKPQELTNEKQNRIVPIYQELSEQLFQIDELEQLQLEELSESEASRINGGHGLMAYPRQRGALKINEYLV